MKEIISDHNGNISSMRIMTFIIVLIIMLTWSYTCIRNGTLVSFDWQDVSVLLTALGAKGGQKHIEMSGKKDK